MTAISKERLLEILVGTFERKHVEAVLEHFELMTHEFQKRSWEEALMKAGKLVEATLKALALRAGLTLPPNEKDFKVDTTLKQLYGVDATAAATTVRVTIPRACRFVYEIASNRGARHDPGEISANEMDASVAVANCSWIVAELFRYAMKGSLNPAEAQSIVTRLIRRKGPLFEDVGGRFYPHISNLGPKEVLLLNLWYVYPERMHRTNLIAAAVRRGATENAARLSLNRLSLMIDDDGGGNLFLLQPGVIAAEEVLESANQNPPKKSRRRRHTRVRR